MGQSRHSIYSTLVYNIFLTNISMYSLKKTKAFLRDHGSKIKETLTVVY
jgi:hypothetical protein